VPGTFSVAFNHPVYGTGTARLTVSGRGTAQYDIKLPWRTVTLEPLRVVAQRVYPGYFDPRTRGRRLNLIARDEIERRGAGGNVGGLLRTIQGVQVQEYTFQGSGIVVDVCIQDRTAIPDGVRQCPGRVAVALDDVLIGGPVGDLLAGLSLSSLESIIYLKPNEAEGRYGYAGRYGVLLIYTRGRGPTAVPTQ